MYGRPVIGTDIRRKAQALTTAQLLRLRAERARQLPELLITGGVVFLDEIAEVPIALQAKLLRVLNRDPVTRVGGEGRTEYEYCYEGMVVAATNADLDSCVKAGTFREDLLFRFQRQIRLPSLAAYARPEALRELVRTIVEDLNNEKSAELDRLGGVEISDRWRRQLQPLGRVDEPIPSSQHGSLPSSISELETEIDFVELLNVPWAKVGEFRGLREIVQSCMSGRKFKSVIKTLLDRATRSSAKTPSGDAIINSIIENAEANQTLGQALASFRRRVIHLIREICEKDPQVVAALAHQFDLEPADVLRTLSNLSRNRSHRR